MADREEALEFAYSMLQSNDFYSVIRRLGDIEMTHDEKRELLRLKKLYGSYVRSSSENLNREYELKKELFSFIYQARKEKLGRKKNHLVSSEVDSLQTIDIYTIRQDKYNYDGIDRKIILYVDGILVGDFVQDQYKSIKVLTGETPVAAVIPFSENRYSYPRLIESLPRREQFRNKFIKGKVTFSFNSNSLYFGRLIPNSNELITFIVK